MEKKNEIYSKLIEVNGPLFTKKKKSFNRFDSFFFP